MRNCFLRWSYNIRSLILDWLRNFWPDQHLSSDLHLICIMTLQYKIFEIVQKQIKDLFRHPLSTYFAFSSSLFESRKNQECSFLYDTIAAWKLWGCHFPIERNSCLNQSSDSSNSIWPPTFPPPNRALGNCRHVKTKIQLFKTNGNIQLFHLHSWMNIFFMSTKC